MSLGQYSAYYQKDLYKGQERNEIDKEGIIIANQKCFSQMD